MNHPTTSPRRKLWLAGSLAAVCAIGATSWLYSHREKSAALVSDLPVKSKTAAAARPPADAGATTTLTAEELDATEHAKPCDNTVLTALDLSRPPTEAELIAAGNLGEKLTPTRSADAELLTDPAERKKLELANLHFGEAIQAWNQHRYDDAVRLFTEHLQAFPESPWGAESMLHIGCHHQYTARFNESVEWFDKILATAPPDSEMYRKAKLRRTILNIDLGQLDAATAGFSEMLKDDPDPNHQSYASYWLIQTQLLKANETALRDCGQKSLSYAAKVMGNEQASADLYQLTAAGPHGYNAAELSLTASQYGLDPHAVHADAGLDELPVPFIAHYKDRHFVTVESVSKDSVKLYDSRISATTEMPRASFEKSWSGFALLMKAVPASANIHPADDLNEIVGGCCGQPTQPTDLGNKCKKGCNTPPAPGLPVHDVNSINMNSTVVDTPMWWQPPVGPPVYLTLMFNSQDSLNNYEPFGEKWSFEYASYLLITPGTRVQVKDGDGRLETFAAPSGGGSTYPITYTSPPGDFRVLKETADHVFTLTSQDGTVYNYAIPPTIFPPGFNPVAPPPGYVWPPTSNVPMLVSIKDRHDNTLSITYNNDKAITKITHSALPGKEWSLVYSNVSKTVSGVTTTVSRVTRIDDPFGRSASFSYDAAARLVGQTDMGGLQYGYTYTTKSAIDATITGSTTLSSQLFINSITTPSGTTNILTEPADGMDTRDDTYTSEELAKGYQAYSSQSYPPPGRKMWTNYRVTVKDHAGNPTEYYFNGFNSERYIRNPKQMVRADGYIRPAQGARLQMSSTLVGGKGEIDDTRIYDETGVMVFQEDSSSYSNTTRLASYIPDGNGGSHYLEYNTQGKPTLVRLNSSWAEDQQINISYISPGGVDVDTITRKIKNPDNSYTLKTLVDYGYYSNRDIQTVTDVNGRTMTYVWNTNGLPQQITDSVTGDVVTFAYDSHSRPYTTSVNGTVVSTTVYDTEGRGTVASTLAPDGRTATYQYDGLNRLTRELKSDNSFTAWQWACCYIEATRSGKVEGGTEKTLRSTLSVHDKRALPLYTTDTDGGTTSFVYDINGKLAQLTDRKGQVTQWVYNTADQLKEKIYQNPADPANPKKELFTYRSYSADGAGKLATFTNRRGQTTTFSYEYDGQLDYVLSGSKVYFDYDSWRRVSKQYLDTSSSTYTFVHDLLGRVTSVDGPWADDTIAYTYDDATRSSTRTSPGGMTQTLTGDAYGRPASIANILGTFTNTYDGVGGPLTAITHTGANAGFGTALTFYGDAYDHALASITSTKPGGATVAKHSYTYDPLGDIKTWKREAPLANPAGATQQYLSTAYSDQNDQLSSFVNQALSGSTVANTGFHYLYDAAGNIASKQIETSSTGATMTAYSHNSLNQLTGIGGSGGVNQIIVRGETNEPATVKVKPSTATDWKNARMLEGNRFESDQSLATGANTLNIQAKDGSNNVSNYTYNLTLAATAATATPPSYDADGNMLGDGIRAYEWDSRARLVKVTWSTDSGKTTEYKYNALGQRSEQIEKTGTTETAHYYYLYEGINLLCRFNGATSTADLDRQYLFQGEQRKTGGVWASHYYTRDHLGSVREVLNSDGTLAARYDYDPYGRRQTQYQASAYTGGCDLGYTGHITQQSAVSGQGEIVLTFYRAYDPELGRWMSVDPLREQGGLNLYGYVENDPLNAWDPYGLWTFDLYAGDGFGFGLHVGYNGGQLQLGLTGGAGIGVSASLDVTDSGCRKEGTQFIAEGNATAGSYAGGVYGTGKIAFGEDDYARADVSGGGRIGMNSWGAGGTHIKGEGWQPVSQGGGFSSPDGIAKSPLKLGGSAYAGVGLQTAITLGGSDKCP